MISYSFYLQGKAVISGIRSKSKASDDLGKIRRKFL